MSARYTYLIIDALTLLGPLALSFDKKVAFRRWWSALLPVMLIVATGFIAWDAAFTQMGVWGFRNEYLLGPSLAGLPLEEWLFFIVVPYACTFIYACVRAYGRWSAPRDLGRRFAGVLGAFLLLAAGIFFNDRWYTGTAFAGCGILLCLLAWKPRLAGPLRFDAFFVSYAIALVLFLIVNGILTALPVVVYNNAENLGIRIYTIPFEDIFYGMLLILANVAGVEAIRAQREKRLKNASPPRPG